MKITVYCRWGENVSGKYEKILVKHLFVLILHVNHF